MTPQPAAALRSPSSMALPRAATCIGSAPSAGRRRRPSRRAGEASSIGRQSTLMLFVEHQAQRPRIDPRCLDRARWGAADTPPRPSASPVGRGRISGAGSRPPVRPPDRSGSVLRHGLPSPQGYRRLNCCRDPRFLLKQNMSPRAALCFWKKSSLLPKFRVPARSVKPAGISSLGGSFLLLSAQHSRPWFGQIICSTQPTWIALTLPVTTALLECGNFGKRPKGKKLLCGRLHGRCTALVDLKSSGRTGAVAASPATPSGPDHQRGPCIGREGGNRVETAFGPLSEVSARTKPS